MSEWKTVLLMGWVILCGCSGARTEPKPLVIRQPDCVDDPFNYDFYSFQDQMKITYCYAVLQTIAKQKAGPK